MHLLRAALVVGLCVAAHGASPEDRALELVNQHQRSLVIVRDAKGGGSAFVAKIGKGTYLVTNQHVVAGLAQPVFVRPDRTELKVGSAAAAFEHDVMTFGVDPSLPAIETMQDVAKETAIGDDVVVPGNPDGAGVVRAIPGKIVGLGPQLVEISAEIVPGSSGSPIIHLKSGKAIGVATYIQRERVDPRKGRLTPSVRRFGYRLDSIKRWESVRWWHYTDEQQTIEKVQRRTYDLMALLTSISERRPVPPEALSDPAVQEPLKKFLMHAGTANTERDAILVTETFLKGLQLASSEDIDHARQRIGYSYFIERLTEERRVRAPITERLELILKSK